MVFNLIPFRRQSGEMTTPSEKFFDPFSLHIMNDIMDLSDVGFRTDVIETPESYILEAELPGLDKEDIKIEIEQGYLTISTDLREDIKEEELDYLHRERRVSQYKRSFPIENIKEDQIEAEYTNGILKITLPKEETEAKEKIKVAIK